MRNIRLQEQETPSEPAPDREDGTSTVLVPFDHQVGGHTQIMLLPDQSTLCKPLVPSELFFYLNIPRPLVGFVPNYKGVVEICRLGEAKNSEFRVQLSSCNETGLLSRTTATAVSSRPNPQYLMLLENIASDYHLPCVLDLKMGTRQHRDDAPDEKRRRQIAKCAASTSATLGVRICGMQTYHRVGPNAYQVCHRDKYHGRSIKNETGLVAELETYFRGRGHLIRPVIGRLAELKTRVAETLQSTPVRFFSSSLLIVSEGCCGEHSRPTEPLDSDGEEVEQEEEEEEEEEAEWNDYDGDDLCLDVLFETLPSSHDDSSHSSLDSDRKPLTPAALIRCPRNHGAAAGGGTTAAQFDVRIIDFAHSSFTNNSSSTNSNDSTNYGFLLGLETLIRLLDHILHHEMLASSTKMPRMLATAHNHKRRRSLNTDSDMPTSKKLGNLPLHDEDTFL